MSKTYAMTGWRIGYAIANEIIVKAMSKNSKDKQHLAPMQLVKKHLLLLFQEIKQPILDMKNKFQEKTPGYV